MQNMITLLPSTEPNEYQKQLLKENTECLFILA